MKTLVFWSDNEGNPMRERLYQEDLVKERGAEMGSVLRFTAKDSGESTVPYTVIFIGEGVKRRDGGDAEVVRVVGVHAAQAFN